MSDFRLRLEVGRSVAWLALILVGCRPVAGSEGRVGVKEGLRVLVHEGGPRFTAARPELLHVMLIKSEGTAMTGALLDRPQRLRTLAVGDTITFIRVLGYPHPILVTDRYLMERRHSYVVPCNKCGFSELFDCPSDLAAATFPGQSIATFSARCPICGGSQLVRLLPPNPRTPRGASETEIAAAVRDIVAEQLDKEGSAIALERTLHDQGADDLDLVEIVFALEEDFVVRIPDSQIGDHPTVTLKDLIKVVTHEVAVRRDDELLRTSD